MSLDIDLIETRDVSVYNANITHNLVEMATHAGIYMHLWGPEKIGITTAKQLINPLMISIKFVDNDPEYFKKFNPDNGWGTYEQFLQFLKDLLQACIENPNAKIEASR